MVNMHCAGGSEAGRCDSSGKVSNFSELLKSILEDTVHPLQVTFIQNIDMHSPPCFLVVLQHTYMRCMAL